MRRGLLVSPSGRFYVGQADRPTQYRQRVTETAPQSASLVATARISIPSLPTCDARTQHELPDDYCTTVTTPHKREGFMSSLPHCNLPCSLLFTSQILIHQTVEVVDAVFAFDGEAALVVDAGG